LGTDNAVEPLEPLGAHWTSLSWLTLRARITLGSSVTLFSLSSWLTGEALNTDLALRARFSLYARIALSSWLTGRTAFAVFAVFAVDAIDASLTLRTRITTLALKPTLALRTVLELSQAQSNELIECGQSGLSASYDRSRLGLHQLDVPLPLQLLIIQRLGERNPPRIN
jgi:hypothetical protein